MGLLRDLYESQAELGDIARIAEVCFVSSSILGGLCGTCGVKLNLAILQR